MNRERAVRILLILGLVALLIVIVERLWAFGQTLQGVVSTLAGAWFLAFAARPFIDMLHRSIVPPLIVRTVKARYGAMWAQRISGWHLPFGLAVGVVYVAMVVIVVGVATISVAAIIPQATDLINRLPEISARIPSLFIDAWADIAERFGFDPNAITSFVSGQDISTQVAQLAGSAAQQALAIVTGTATLIGQFFLMLILSLYIVTEGTLIQRQLFAVLPTSAHEFARAFIDAVGRAFDGYLRGYIVSAFVRALVTFALFSLFQVNFGIVLALVYAVLSLIPLIGSPVAILIAAIVTLVVRPDAVLPVTISLFVFDQVVAYVITPRIMSNTVGVPGLVGLLSITIGLQLFGFWGLIFSVPAMGAVYILLFEYYLPRRRKAEGLPEIDPELYFMMRPRRPDVPAANRPATPEAETPSRSGSATGTNPNPSLHQK
ncbi:MAG: AI-2E family transporter [Chloroflexi bacterium]|nr:AI-2E family transporter [Chloroflexota bacterium]